MSKLLAKPGPRELDLDLTRMRAEKIDELRRIMRDLDDIDAVERVLNGQTHEIATTAAVAALAHRNGNGHRAAKMLLQAGHAGQDGVDVNVEEPETKLRRKRKKERVDSGATQSRILDVLTIGRKRGPLQAKDIVDGIETKYPPPYASQSTVNRALMMLREDKKIKMLQLDGRKYPSYELREESVKSAVKSVKPAKRTKRAHGGGRSSGVPYKENGVGGAVLRVLADGDPKGMTISQIVEVLDKDGTTVFLPDHAHGSQVSWALKGHRNRHRLKTIEKDGIRTHQLLRPAISVTKG